MKGTQYLPQYLRQPKNSITINPNMALFALYLSVLLAFASANVLSPQDLPVIPATTTYDYVVVGCGIAGLVVSMRLSETQDVSVICLEAGPLSVVCQHDLD